MSKSTNTTYLRRLPMLGSATYYFKSPGDNPDAVCKTLRGEKRQLVEMELAVARGNFDEAAGYYESMPMDSECYLPALRCSIIGAMGRGDLPLFDRIVADLRAYPSQADIPYARLAAEITECWIRQWLHIKIGYPDWVLRMDLSDIPSVWQHQVGYIGVRTLLARRNFDAAYSAASLLLAFNKSAGQVTIANVYLNLCCAFACRELGHIDEMFRWFRNATQMTCPHGIILPYLGLVLNAENSLEKAIREVSPQALEKAHRLTPIFFRNMVRFHDRFTGDKSAQNLGVREFYIAYLLSRNLSYKEIAERLELSVGRTRNIVSGIYEKLGVHHRRDLVTLVW